jgi:CheY-like chemotaxis protein
MASQKLILLIDDDPDVLEAVSAVLGSRGFAVRTAASGKEGLAVVEDVKPDLVLCDMMMEEVDAGLGVAQALRERIPGVPVFLMSSIGEQTAGYADVGSLGFAGVLQKPVDPARLLSTLDAALAG